ncbi:hypothetical protein ACL2XP_20120 [Sodalis sp. RH21]|uniref:hypothetical protein n=1 Tax=unclassified Sodalis (in: enterobacteria) TaxID=2636512 RepID=UPI0039B63AD2
MNSTAAENTIYHDIYSSLSSAQEKREADNLFAALKSIQHGGNTPVLRPLMLGKNTPKNIMLKLLYAMGQLPDAASGLYAAGPGGASVSALAGSAMPIGARSAILPATSATVSPAMPEPLLLPDGPPRSRIRRGTADISDLYLPSRALAERNLGGFLQLHGQTTRQPAGDSNALINGAIDFIRQHPHGLSTVARRILKHSGYFGAKTGEDMTADRQRKTVNRWIGAELSQHGICGVLAEAFIAYSRNITAKPIEISRAAGHFRLMLLARITDHGLESGQPPAGNAGLSPDAINYINANLILPVMPLFTFEERHPLLQEYAIGTLEWGYLHAGAAFSLAAGLETNEPSAAYLLQMGIFFESLLRENILDSEWNQVFMIPAIFHHIRTRFAGGQAVEVDDIIHSGGIRPLILEKYFLDCDKLNAKADPFRFYSIALHNYKNRTQLAEEILGSVCNITDRVRLPLLINQYKEAIGEVPCTVLDIPDAAKHLRLPDLDRIYMARIHELASAFAAVDDVMINAAFNAIGPDDYAYLNAAELISMNASFTHRVLSNMPWGYLECSAYHRFIIKDHVEIIAAKKDRAERIYALLIQGEQYVLQRIDRDVGRYYSLIKNFDASLAADGNMRLILTTSGRGTLKGQGRPVGTAAHRLSQRHKALVIKNLYHSGFEATLAEKVTGFLRSLIPFHDCIKSSLAGEREEAIVACAFDAVGILPLLHMGLGLAGRAAMNFGKGGRMALHHVMSSFAGRQSIREAGLAGINDLANYAMLPTKALLNRATLTSLGINIVQLFDPGLALPGRLGLAAVKRVADAVRAMKKQGEFMQKILPRLESALTVRQVTAASFRYETAILPGTRLRLPVTRLAGDKYHGKDVYLRINQQTGDVFGIKYTLSAGQTLERIPAPFADRLHNLLTQGLSGRGAPAQGRAWLASTPARDTPRHVHSKRVRLYTRPDPAPAPAESRSLADVKDRAQWRTYWRQNKYLENNFHIETYGDRGSETLLFPEHRIRVSQEAIDASDYERAFARLSPAEKEAVRTWTLIEDDSRGYSDGSLNLAVLGKLPINVEINQKLSSGEPFTAPEHAVFTGLTNALRGPIPRQQGEYLRIAIYRTRHAIPWGSGINVGDIVTNAPQFMSVSADDGFIRLFAEQTAEDGPFGEPGLKAMIIYKIVTAKRCMPLLPLAASAVIHEIEYLYPPHTYFRVKGMSLMRAESEFIYPQVRIGVVLEELDELPAQAKNLFSGAASINIETPRPLP